MEVEVFMAYYWGLTHQLPLNNDIRFVCVLMAFGRVDEICVKLHAKTFSPNALLYFYVTSASFHVLTSI
jgi:hypothetical protein